MTEEAKKRLLAELPEGQRRRAGECIDWAEAQGWTSLGLWTWDDPADITDLVGVPAGGDRQGMVSSVLGAMQEGADGEEEAGREG